MRAGSTFCRILISLVIALTFTLPLYGKDERVPTPKEFGVYIKTAGGTKRLLPNVVFDDKGMLFIESNRPQRFMLKDLDYFIVYGSHNIEVLTINPLLFLQASGVGKPRYIFGKNVEFTVQNKGNNLFVVKPKGLLGRGYFCLWIEDSAWDFVVE